MPWKPNLKTGLAMSIDRRAIGRKSRRKGKAWERQVVNRLKAIGIDAKRGWWQSRSGSEIPDVIAPKFWIECGHGDKMDGARKLAQAIKLCGQKSLIPVAITRRTG